MAIILSFETSTPSCSVAIHRDGKLLAYAGTLVEKSHAEKITLLTEQVLDNAKLKISDINAVAISAGPGSYTGLRIASSTAKGFCFALDLPMIAVSTLQSMARNIQMPDYLVCPMLDARRMEVYCALFDYLGNEISPVEAKIIDENSFSELKNVVFCGDGAMKCKDLIRTPGAVFRDDIFPSAIQIGYIAEEHFKQNKFVDAAYFEPFYLKEFIALKSSKSVL
jgi:tRNA threonylcarbamoyladenosine biosynthesis protein TsaB